jgi:hypothetical protein
MPILDGYMDEPQLAEALDKTPRTLARWRAQRIGPPVTRIGRKPFYNVESARAWLKSREQKMVRDGGRA